MGFFSMEIYIYFECMRFMGNMRFSFYALNGKNEFGVVIYSMFDLNKVVGLRATQARLTLRLSHYVTERRLKKFPPFHGLSFF